jgi:hypothetical protein
MTSIILALLLLFSPDGSDKSGRGKHASAQRQTQPVKQTTLTVTGSTQQPNTNTNNETAVLTRQTTPSVTTVSQGISSIYTGQITYGDTVQKQTTEPAAALKWLP